MNKTIKSFGEQWISFNKKLRTLNYEKEFSEWIKPLTINFFKNKKVLDAGCGTGIHAEYVSNFAKNVLAIDASESIICVKPKKNLRVKEADLLDLNLNETFDIIYSIGVIHHTSNPKKAFLNLVDHLKDKGTIIIWVYGNETDSSLIYFVSFIREFTSKNKSLLIFLTYVSSLTLFLLRNFNFFRKSINLPQIKNWNYIRTYIFCYDHLSPEIAHYFKKEELKRWNLPIFKEFNIYSLRNNSYTIIAKRK